MTHIGQPQLLECVGGPYDGLKRLPPGAVFEVPAGVDGFGVPPRCYLRDGYYEVSPFRTGGLVVLWYPTE